MPKHTYKTYTPESAKAQGFERVTADYNIPAEIILLEKAIEQMGDHAYLLVATVKLPRHIQIWRRKKEVRFGEEADEFLGME